MAGRGYRPVRHGDGGSHRRPDTKGPPVSKAGPGPMHRYWFQPNRPLIEILYVAVRVAIA